MANRELDVAPSAAVPGGVRAETRRVAVPREVPPPVKRAFAAGSVVAMLGVLGSVYAMLRFRPLDATAHRVALGVGMLCAAGTAVLVVRVYRAVADVHLRARLALFVFAALTVFAHGVLVSLNGVLDRSATTERTVEVVAQAYDDEEDETELRVRSWQSPGETVAVTIVGRFQETHVVVPTRPGFFGWAWQDGPVR